MTDERISMYHLDDSGLNKLSGSRFDHIYINDKDELVGLRLADENITRLPLNEVDIDDQIKHVTDLIDRRARELEGYTELYAGLVVQRNLPGAKVVRKK